jgi:hypothetical protein
VEGSCKYTEYVDAESQQGVVLQLGGWARGSYTRPQNWMEGPVVSPCEHSNEPLGPIKGMEFFN